jgi:hypothetical protein
VKKTEKIKKQLIKSDLQIQEQRLKKIETEYNKARERITTKIAKLKQKLNPNAM